MHALALRVVGGTDVASAVETSDTELLQATARGSQKAYSQILKRHYAVVYRVVWRMMAGHVDAQDITQEAFLRLWNQPGQLREAGALRGWLIRVATNLVNDRFRTPVTVSVDDQMDLADERGSAEQALQQKQLAQKIDAAVAALPERQRLAITLVQFEHMSNISASEIMEITVDALESLLARARRGLKQHLAGEWQALHTSARG
jgi:RNA polymerase sigma-70 factor, ECF subfamily